MYIATRRTGKHLKGLRVKQSFKVAVLYELI